MGFDQFSPKTKREDLTVVGTGTFGADQGFSTGANALQAFFGPVAKVGKKATLAQTLNYESNFTDSSTITNLAPTVNVASGEDSVASASPSIDGGGSGGFNWRIIGLVAGIGLVLWWFARKTSH